MGAGQMNNQISVYKKIEAKITNTNCLEFERMFLRADDIVTKSEKIRNRVVSSRELLIKITKVNMFRRPTLLHAFKVWCWCVIACNQGKLDGIQFKADLVDYNNPGQEFKIEEFSKEFQTLLNYGSETARMIDPQTLNYENDNLVFGKVGKCGDLRLQLWPSICQDFFIGVKQASQIMTYFSKRMHIYIEQMKDLRNNKEFMANKGGLTKVVDANIQNYVKAQLVLEAFKDSSENYLNECRELISNYQSILNESVEIGLNIYENEEIEEYAPLHNQYVFKCKINYITTKYFKDDIELKSESQINQDGQYKQERKKRKPLYDTNKISLDINSPQSKFPTKFHWVQSAYFDTIFSVQAVALAELESARKEGEQARKQMFKYANIGKLYQKTILQAVQIWIYSILQYCSLNQIQLSLTNFKPWIEGKFNNFQFPNEIFKFKSHLEVYLDYYSPIKYSKLVNYYEEYLQRWDVILQSKDQFHRIILKEIETQDQYYALTKFYRNVRANDIYLDRIKRLFQVTIEYNGQMGKDLYDNLKQIVMEAEQVVKRDKILQMSSIVDEYLKEYLADEDQLQRRKSSRLQEKLSINYYNEKNI